MSFCRNCGTQLSDSSTFCPSCGTKVENSLTAGMPQTAAAPYGQFNNGVSMKSIRKMQVAEADDVYQYFMKKSDAYDELVDCQRKLANIKPPKRSYLFMLLSLYILVPVMGAVPGVVTVLLFGLFVVVFILLVKRYKRKVKECDNLMESMQSRIDDLSNELADYYDAYPDCPIGPEYTFPSVLNELIDYVHSGRADSLKEAINIMITDGKLADMEMNTEAAASGARTAAVFSALNFFLN